MKSFQKFGLTAILATAAVLATGCGTSSTPVTTEPTAVASPGASAAAQVTDAPATASPAPTFAGGIIAKGVANDGKGDYLQTSIADSDPAMQYNPALADAAAKAHFTEADLAAAQKVVVKFIAEEAIDSTLNGGTDVDGWFAAHKDQIHSANQPIMLADLKAGKDDVAREQWIASKPGYSYVHGDTTPRIKTRTITPTKIEYVEGNGLQGVSVSTNAVWTMEVTGGSNSGIQHSTGEITYSVAKDPADGKWKIAGYDTNFHTAEG